MKNKKNLLNKGLTLIEVVLAISISSIVFLGIMFFLTQVNTDFLMLDKKTSILSTFLNFQNELKIERVKYSESKILVDNTDSYDTILLYNSGSNDGVLVGVVDFDSGSSNYLKLDGISNFQFYGQKLLAIKKIYNIDSLQENPDEIYNINFTENDLFKGLVITNFEANNYNSGTIIDVSISVIYDYNEDNVGMVKNQIINSDSIYNFNLDL